MKKTVQNKQSSASTAQDSSIPNTNGSGTSLILQLKATASLGTGEIATKSIGSSYAKVVIPDNILSGQLLSTKKERNLFVKIAAESLAKRIGELVSGSKSGETKNGQDTGSHS